MRAVENSDDLRRVLALPRRAPALDASIVDELSEILRTPSGTMKLRPLQALALHDIGTYGGAFLPLDVGEGKTLISLLAPVVLESRRPLLMLRAHLVQKTARERDELARHWCIPNHIRLLSYQTLGVVNWAAELDVYQPDLIIFDESQAVKNRDAAVTRRVERYLEAHPETRVVAMTGTIMRKSITDFAHVIRWALKAGAPVPMDDGILEQWALALDEKVENEFQRLQPGALMQLADPDEVRELGEVRAVRRGFRRRLRETPGVVCSSEEGTEVITSTGAPVRLDVRPLRYELSPTTIAHFKTLRDDKLTPSGEEIWEAAQVWQHARELALGFHQEWDPAAPQPWRTARRAWFSLVREILSRSRTLDSPEQVAQACDLGRLPTGTKIPGEHLEHWRDVLASWRAIKDSFVPNPVPVWHDDSALRVAAQWMQQAPGIVWVEHVPFGERLSEITGAKYYGQKGLAADGSFVDDGDPRRCAIVSVDANKEGRNLQKKWSRNLITTPFEGADLWQQVIGRTHRPGVTVPVVRVDVFLGCAEHVRAWQKALAGASSIRDTVGTQSKLLIADTSNWPSSLEMASWSGPRWDK